VIVALGGQLVRRADDVQRLLRELPQGRDVSLTYIRGKQEVDTLIRW
jgi:hypothetical protein